MSGGIRLTAPGGKSLDQIYAEGLGFLSWTFPSAEAGGGTVLASQIVYGGLLPVRAGMTITNVHVWVTTVAITTTACKVGLLNTSGAQLGITADLGVAWETLGMKTHALITPYVVPADGFVYVAPWNVAATGAALARGLNVGGLNATSLAGKPLTTTRQTGQATFPSPATLILFNTNHWLAVS